VPRIGDAERRRTFGAPCTPSNLRTYLTPWGLRVQAHYLVVARLAAACALAKRASSWTPQRIDSYACRQIRGSDATSLHAFGLAWDFFSTPPNVVPPGGVWEPEDAVPPSFAAAFTHFGFVWGATFGRRDVPHIEWADGRPPPVPVASTPDPLTQEDDMLTPDQAADLKAVKNYVAAAEPRLASMDASLARIAALLAKIEARGGGTT
jgi:hypothetical protein